MTGFLIFVVLIILFGNVFYVYLLSNSSIEKKKYNPTKGQVNNEHVKNIKQKHFNYEIVIRETRSAESGNEFKSILKKIVDDGSKEYEILGTYSFDARNLDEMNSYFWSIIDSTEQTEENRMISVEKIMRYNPNELNFPKE